MPIGISFRETMAGPFTLGTDDPREGKRIAQRGREKLAMHAEVGIDDLAAFIDDPQHAGSLSGTIDFPSLGEGLRATKGVFNLFRPSEDPALKLMIYEMAFVAGGQAYYLAGEKQVKDDPGFDLWSDTTTLYTRLHRGADKSGEVVGAGVLSLGMGDLLRLLSTLQVSGTESRVEKARAVGNFGQFFLGALWSTYGKSARVNEGVTDGE